MKKEKERVICAIPKEDIYHNADNVEGKRLSGRTESDLQAELSEKAASLPEAEDCSSDLITIAYYVDSQRLVSLPGFFHVHASASGLSLGTTDYKIEGRPGTWTAREEYWVDGNASC